MKYSFVESDTDLKNLCDTLLKEKVIGVDLEADSMHSFKEKICLIQVASAGRAFIIDPFKIQKPVPFLKVLENENIVKIFHGADFDIRSLDRDYQARVKNLFDTEIACRFLGIRQRGLADLLKDNFNVDVKKKYQKADWSRRPVKQEMIEYSVYDVVYLEKLYDIVCRKLEHKARFWWAKEEFHLQENVRYENNHVLPLFQNFKGAGRMDGRTLAVLENLLQARMKIAEKKDQPLFKIMSNACLKTMAVEKPVTIDKIVQLKALSSKQVDMYGHLCVNAITKAVNLDHEKLPHYPKIRKPRQDALVKKRIKKLKQMREQLSSSMKIEPGFLLNNGQIISIAFKNPDTLNDLRKIENLRNWQCDALGEDIISTLEL